MKIICKSKENKRAFLLCLPLCLVTSKFACKLICNKTDLGLNGNELYKLLKAVKKDLRKHKSLRVLEIIDRDGDIVVIEV